MIKAAVSLYVSFDGEGYTAKYNSKTNSVTGCRKIHLAEWKEQLRLFHRPAVCTIRDTQNFEQNPECNSQFDHDLISWCRETAGISYAGTAAASHALLALALLTIKRSTFVLIYELEGHLYFLLVQNQAPASLIRIAAEESELGISKLLTRCVMWYRSCSICTVLPEPAVIGKVTSLETTGTEHLFPETETVYCAAAGTPLLPAEALSLKAEPICGVIRTFRLISAAAALAALLLVTVTALALSIINAEESRKIADMQQKYALTAEERIICDSAAKEAALRITETYRERETVRWSSVLSTLSAVPSSGVTIERLGSRPAGTALELAFDGVGTGKNVVTAFIQALKQSKHFSDVQLTQFDKAEAGWRFRVQCLTK